MDKSTFVGIASRFLTDKPRPSYIVHDVTLASFEIARDPVTNAQYSAFVQAKGVKPPGYWSDG